MAGHPLAVPNEVPRYLFPTIGNGKLHDPQIAELPRKRISFAFTIAR